MKICSKCGLEKTLSEFHKDKSAKDGHSCSCKSCKNAQFKAKRMAKGKVYYVKNLSINNPSINEHIVLNCRVCENEFFPRNSRHLTCDNCTDTVVRIRWSIGRSTGWNKKKKYYTPDNEQVILITKKYIMSNYCTYCHRPYTIDNPKSLDHIIPKSIKIDNRNENINICCLDCNKCRGNLLLGEWINLCQLVAGNNSI